MDKKRWHTAVLLAALTLLPFGVSAERLEEEPTAMEMTGDLLVARPIGLGIFALGTVTYVATLPFSLLGGNSGDAAEALVFKPAEEVFVRCLGCTRPGRKERLRETREP